MPEDSGFLGLPFFGSGRRRARVARACALIQDGVPLDEAAESAGLKADDARRFRAHLDLLFEKAGHLSDLRDFALNCGDESADRLLETCSECDATLRETERMLTEGELDLGLLVARLERFVERADDERSQIEESVALTERASQLLDELDEAIRAFREHVQAAQLPPIDQLDQRLSDFEKTARQLRRRAKRSGYSEALIAATVEAANEVCAIDIGAVLQSAQDSRTRVSTVYEPAIAVLESTLAPYASDSKHESAKRSSSTQKGVSLEDYEPYTQFESTTYPRLSGLTLKARELLEMGSRLSRLTMTGTRHGATSALLRPETRRMAESQA